MEVNYPKKVEDYWKYEEDDLKHLIGPIFDSPAFKRLNSITFLGILSPQFAEKTKSPIFESESLKKSKYISDGSRRDHSVGVAIIAYRICCHLGFNETQLKYALAWGLLHDLGNWPLSHTAQRAFTELLGVDTKIVREWLIIDDNRSPKKYRSAEYLEKSDIDPERMLGLFRKKPDNELKPVSLIFRSKLTPDMLEGVWRSGRAFGVMAPDPSQFNHSFHSDILKDICVVSDSRKAAIDFWKVKRNIYSRFFGSETVIRWESAWSAAVLDIFSKEELSLESSLDLKENEIINKVCKNGLPKIDFIHRWKPPIQQRFKKPIPKKLFLHKLDEYFIEEPSKILGETGGD